MAVPDTLCGPAAAGSPVCLLYPRRRRRRSPPSIPSPPQNFSWFSPSRLCLPPAAVEGSTAAKQSKARTLTFHSRRRRRGRVPRLLAKRRRRRSNGGLRSGWPQGERSSLSERRTREDRSKREQERGRTRKRHPPYGGTTNKAGWHHPTPSRF